MKDLMNKEITMTSLEIAEYTGKRHDHVMRDIRNMLNELSIDAPSFGGIFKDSYGRDQKCFILPKKEILCLVSGYSIKLRMAIITRLEELENKHVSLSTPQSFSDALRLAADQQDMIEEQKKLINHQRAENATMKPKALFADAVAGSDTSILIGSLAKLIKQNGVDIGQNRLFKWLRDSKYLSSRKGLDFNNPTQYGMDRKLFELKERSIMNPDGSVRVTKTTMVTGKGQAFFINLFLDESGEDEAM